MEYYDQDSPLMDQLVSLLQPGPDSVDSPPLPPTTTLDSTLFLVNGLLSRCGSSVWARIHHRKA